MTPRCRLSAASDLAFASLAAGAPQPQMIGQLVDVQLVDCTNFIREFGSDKKDDVFGQLAMRSAVLNEVGDGKFAIPRREETTNHDYERSELGSVHTQILLWGLPGFTRSVQREWGGCSYRIQSFSILSFEQIQILISFL